MGAVAAVMLAVGVPLLLIALGFVFIVTKVFGGSDGRVESARTLELARQLELTLGKLESRLTALEDIIMSADKDKGGRRE